LRYQALIKQEQASTYALLRRSGARLLQISHRDEALKKLSLWLQAQR